MSAWEAVGWFILSLPTASQSFASTHPHIVSVGLVAGDSSFKSWFLTVSQCQDLEESLQTYIGKRYVSAGTSFREGLIGWMVQTFTKD